LRRGSRDLGIKPYWVLCALAYESGLDPLKESTTGARGLWQFDGTYHLNPTGEKIRRLYEQKDPVAQLSDGFNFWVTQKRLYRIAGFPSRAHFFCLNFAPARLQGVKPAPPDTLIFPSDSKNYETHKAFDRIKKGYLVLMDFDWPLQKASQVYAQRLRREMEAVETLPEES
jgi:hypothetical protein